MSGQGPAALPTMDEVIAQHLGGKDQPAPVKEEQPAETAEVSQETSEEPAQPEVEEKKPKDLVSSKFAALSRRERELRAREREFEDRAKAAEERQKQEKEIESKLSQLKKAPLKVLKELGLSYADITQDALGAYEEPKVDPVEERFKTVETSLSKIDEVEAKLEARFNQLAEREANLAMTELMTTIKDTAKDEKYEMIRTMSDQGSYELVRDVIQEYWSEHEQVLDFDEACDIVEKYYEEAFLEKFAKTRKLQSRFQPKASDAKAESPKPSQSRATPTKADGPTTLRNSQATASEATVDIDKMSKHEAIAYLSKQLKFID